MPKSRPLLYLPLILLLTACGTGRSQDTKPKTEQKTIPRQKSTDTTEPNLYRARADDTEMNEAIAKARSTLPQFDRAIASNKYDRGWNMLKVRFPTPSGGGEHIWLAGITRIKGHYEGIVNDTVYEATQIKEGDRVIINETDITDWMYGRDSVMHGAYTTRVILSRMTPEERAMHDRAVKYRIED